MSVVLLHCWYVPYCTYLGISKILSFYFFTTTIPKQFYTNLLLLFDNLILKKLLLYIHVLHVSGYL